MKTIKLAIESISRQFEAAELYYGHGTDNAWDEAVFLLLSVLDLPQDSGDEVADKLLSEDEWSRIQVLATERIQTRQPLAYLLHSAYFCGLKFYVDERVLVPRSLIGEWISEAFSPWLDMGKVKTVLEIGTGSGCIAIAIAKYFPAIKVDAVDISPEALEVAAKNVKTHAVDDRVKLIESDCYAAIDDQRYDLIIANPPYVGEAEMKTIPEEYRHEPELGLVSADNGLELPLRILNGAKSHLNGGGALILEVGNSDVEFDKRIQDLPVIWLEHENTEQGLMLIYEKDLL